MQVILLEKIRNLGALGDLVTVKPGFGRNYLIPTHKAVRASKENIAKFEERRSELERKAKEIYDAAAKRAEELANAVIAITAKASEEGKLFGSIGTREIAEAMVAKGYTVNKSEIMLPMGTLREIGDYEVDVQLHTDVIATINISLVAE